MKQALVRLTAVSLGGGLAVAIATAALAHHSQETAVTTVPESIVTTTEQRIIELRGPDCAFELADLNGMEAAPSTWTLTEAGRSFDVQADQGMHYQITVSGSIDDGPAVLHSIHLANSPFYLSYHFDPPVTSATNLALKSRPGPVTDVERIWFCYGKGDPPQQSPSPSPTSTTPAPSPTTPAPAPTTPTATPSVAPSMGPSVDPTMSAVPSVEPGERPVDSGDLPSTGSRVGMLIGAGAVLLIAGGATVAAIAIRRRRSLTNLLED